MNVNRREFLKGGLGGVATIVIGSHLPWLQGHAYAATTQALQIFITDAMKEMVTHNPENEAKCYFWVYEMHVNGIQVPADCPGPVIVASAGDTINVTVTNLLDEDHAFFIPGIVDSGPIAPLGGWAGSFQVPTAGAWLYYDNLNEPVNRMMGLHGALIVMPTEAAVGRKFTPYDPANVTPGVQHLFDQFGESQIGPFGEEKPFPGLAWEEGDEATECPPFRQYVWLTHEASSKLFAEVGAYPAGLDYPAEEFKEKFLRGPFAINNSAVGAPSYIPQYFTINGQSGFFAHHNPSIVPFVRVGEPVVVHILNAGLWTHSMHLHANHFFVTSVNDVVSDNPLWIDVFNVEPMDRVDYTVPAMRPPDIGSVRGIGLAENPQTAVAGHPVWPPIEEFDVFMPDIGDKKAEDIFGNEIDLAARQSPLCYPMHDHSEPSQTSQGGNYNCGLIAGIYFVGDRNTPGHMNFPLEEHMDILMGHPRIYGIRATGLAAPAFGHVVHEM